MACAIIKELELSESFWSYVATYTTYILNRVPTHALDKNITSY